MGKENVRKFIITFFTLAITFVIPITLTRVIQDNPEDLRTAAQEITAQAAETVNIGMKTLQSANTINLPVLGDVTYATLGLYIVALVFFVFMIIAGINLFKSRKSFE